MLRAVRLPELAPGSESVRMHQQGHARRQLVLVEALLAVACAQQALGPIEAVPASGVNPLRFQLRNHRPDVDLVPGAENERQLRTQGYCTTERSSVSS